jgi:Leucine-rich repeat (LRR) protein
MQTSQGGGADLRFIRKLDNLRILNMSRPDLSDEDLACVEDLTQLERLSAVSTDGFTDSGLIHLRRLHALYGLNIFSNALSDSGICGLLPSPTMRKLIFGSPQISDAAVAYIVQAFPYIEYLELTGTKITANGLQQLQKLSELRTLRLITTCIGDDDLEFVANLHDLTELVVGIPQVTDNGLRHLRSLSNLRVLDLQETAVTDAGVRDLLSNSLNCLTTLRVGHTTVSEELVRELQAIRPQLFIERQ